MTLTQIRALVADMEIAEAPTPEQWARIREALRGPGRPPEIVREGWDGDDGEFCVHPVGGER